MRARSAPALLPAVALVAGVAGSCGLSVLSLPLLTALAGLGLALGRRPGSLLAWCAVGAALSAGSWQLPERQALPLPIADRPVAAEVVVTGHWLRGAFSWSAPARLEVWRWRDQVDALPRTVWLELPEDMQPPPLGTRMRVRGTLARGNGYRNRLPVAPGRLRLRVKSESLIESRTPPSGIALFSHRLRDRVDRAVRAQKSTVGVAFARALVLGDTTGIDPAWRRGLRRSGIAHLLAVSGLNVTLMAAFAYFAGWWLPPRSRLLAALFAIGGYLLLVGPMPPLARAAAMGSLAVLALVLRRAPFAANALAVVVIALVAASPALVSDLSFQLTVSATAGLVVLGPGLARRWTGLPAGLRPALAATVAAQIATLPIALATFHYLALLGPLVNLLAVPWAAVALAVDVLWMGLAVAWPKLAAVGLPLLDLIALPFTWPSELSATRLPIEPTVIGAAAAGLLALAGAAVAWWPRRLLPLALGAGALIALAGWRLDHARSAPMAGVTMLDVGQGDALLLRDESRALLVDGGGWSEGDFGGRVLLPALAAEGVERLDAVVLTHADRDHCRGLVDLVDYLPVDAIWTSATARGEPCGEELASRPGPALRILARGDQMVVGRWRISALSPDSTDTGAANDLSLVLLAEALGRRLLLTGDIEETGELRLVRRYGDRLQCDLLKLAHHGSKTSTTAPFLRAVRPRLALISVGAGNSYGHPSDAVLARLAAARVAVARSDRLGAVVVRWQADGPLALEFPGQQP